MKVVCVDDKERDPAHNARFYVYPNGWPVYGEVYTVSNAFNSPLWGPLYSLVEKPILAKEPTATPYWQASRFVPLSYFESEFCVMEETAEPATA